MEIGEWLRRYAIKVKKIAPETTDFIAVRFAIAGLGSKTGAQVLTDMAPEDHAEADLLRIRSQDSPLAELGSKKKRWISRH